jgi:hypothetical protein
MHTRRGREQSKRWRKKKWISTTVRTTKINRRVGGSYIPLPEKVKNSNSNSCINVKNEDDRCIEYSILASKCFDLVSINGKTIN